MQEFYLDLRNQYNDQCENFDNPKEFIKDYVENQMIYLEHDIKITNPLNIKSFGLEDDSQYAVYDKSILFADLDTHPKFKALTKIVLSDKLIFNAYLTQELEDFQNTNSGYRYLHGDCNVQFIN